MTMMASLRNWINDVAQPEHAQADVDVSLATAVLLCEVVRADYRMDDSEITLMREQLQQRFELDPAALDELMTLARQEAETAVDHHRFVRELRDRTGYQERVALVQQMWALAFADGEKDALEEHRIRALAELLHVSHGDFVRTRIAEENRAAVR
ncbi:TerB family tellurite resistance protein [Halomonas denitrificans]|uniref:tellurite resistance TerB family protein n=1 Tax=Halomonas denitrificans TaxID=370769 RepID=UPI001CD2C66E|nr:TerB family tellurite resistance protein [Halomonas denitrificans]MCA0976731.1 TerB family tellurite resistance protein [Halomonas denitrificans]